MGKLILPENFTRIFVPLLGGGMEITMELKGGIIPTMLAAYDLSGKIDIGATGALVDWYIEKGVHGLFTLCQSTEMFFLSAEEKEVIGKAVMEKCYGKIPVVASGITADTLDGQIEEAKRIADIGVDGIVFLRNRLGESESEYMRALSRIVREIPENVSLGFYECPYPNWQHLTDSEFSAAVDTGRFRFLKDTSCDVEVMRRREKIRTEKDKSFGLYNANSATLLESVRFGYDGFSGVMANFHPELYVWMYEHKDDPRADIIDKYVGIMSVIEARCYPICAKRYLAKYENLPITDFCRSAKDTTLSALTAELEDVYELTRIARGICKMEKE